MALDARPAEELTQEIIAERNQDDGRADLRRQEVRQRYENVA